jgi:hypothetical protein
MKFLTEKMGKGGVEGEEEEEEDNIHIQTDRQN